MKQIVGLTLLLFVTLSYAEEESKPILKKQLIVAKRCAEKHKVDMATFYDLSKLKLPETQSDYCMFGCIMDGLGMFDDGKFKYEAYTKMNDIIYPEHKEQIHKYTKACLQETGENVENQCDFAEKLMKCLVPEAKKINLPVVSYEGLD